MSTTIKRIALVAVAALGLGVVAVAPSQATPNANLWCYTADGISAQANTVDGNSACGGVAGTYNNVTIKATAFAAGDVVELTNGNFVSTDNSGTLNSAKTAVVLAAGTTTLVVATPVVGTITAKIYKNTAGVVSTTATETLVITVAATALSGTYNAAKSPIYLVAGETHTATADATTTPSKVKTYVSSDSATASIVVYSMDALGAAVTNDTYTATITSGPGTVNTKVVSATGQYDSATALNDQSSASVGKFSVSARPDNSGRAAFFIYANGQAGNTTVTIRNSAGTVLSTKTVSFSDTTVASITATVLKNYVQGDSTSHTTNVIKLTLKDAAGNAITTPAVYPTVTSSAATIGTATQVYSSGVADTATADSTGSVFWGITPAAAAAYGPITLTFTAGLVSTTAVVTLSSAVAASFTASAGTTSANGDIVYSVKAVDAKGYAVPDGLALSNYVSSLSATGTAGTGSAASAALTGTSVSGAWTTAAVAAPSSTTDITTAFLLTGTAGTASSYLSAALAGSTVNVKFSVTNPALDAATDAANEAQAAASDATDAALAAADAADAATAAAQDAVDAVAALSTQVNKLISALKAQITTLTNLVIKIQKKVKA